MVILGAGMYQHIYLLNCFLLQDVSGVVENDGSFWDWQFKRIGQINLPNKWGIPWRSLFSHLKAIRSILSAVFLSIYFFLASYWW